MPGRRQVLQAEAVSWLAETTAAPGTSVVTSLPDVSELPQLDLEGWRTWFADAARAVLRFVPDAGAAIFYQSDIRRGGVWIDKAYLVQRAAEREGKNLLFHKIVCREPADTPIRGRPGYAHLLCFSAASLVDQRSPLPDVLGAPGFMSWSKATGEAACRLACDFLLRHTTTRLVVDPFCGQGTVLAVANALGLDALGIDISARKCRAARRLMRPA